MYRDLACCAEDWVNLGGQLAPEPEVERLLDDIKAGRLNNWQEIHDRMTDVARLPSPEQAEALMR